MVALSTLTNCILFWENFRVMPVLCQMRNIYHPAQAHHARRVPFLGLKLGVCKLSTMTVIKIVP